MIGTLHDLYNRPFVRNVATVATGTAVSQVITMAFAPIVTRLYGPEAYGLQGVFMSVLGILITFAALGYPTAIVLPKSDSEAWSLVKISVYVVVFMAVIIAINLLFFGKWFLSLLNAQGIYDYIYLLPIAMVLAVFGEVLAQWLIRKKAFKITAQYSAINTFVMGLFKSIMGVFYPTALILILTNSFSRLTVSLLPYLVWFKSGGVASNTQQPNRADADAGMLELALRHRDFPLFRAPQNLINAFSQSLPILILSCYFGTSAAGQYSIAMAVLVMPVSLIGKSVMSVFYPRITEAINNGENAKKLIIKATRAMAITGIWPFLIIMIFGPFLFGLVFGAEWKTAGVYAQWLSIWIFFQFINKPAVAAIPSLRLQGGLLVYELFSTGFKILALWIGYAFLESHVAAIALFSLFGVAAYVWLIFWVIRRSGALQVSPEVF